MNPIEIVVANLRAAAEDAKVKYPGLGMQMNPVYDLAGPANVNLRMAIVEHLTGKKLPKAKCGVNYIGELLGLKG